MLVLPLFLFLFTQLLHCHGHGHLMEPKSRNYRASVEGSWWCPTCDPFNTPMMESCPHCMNNYGGTLSSLCGISQSDSTDNYDFPKSMNGSLLPWKSQAKYKRDSIINVTVGITAYHCGHIEMYACPRSQVPSQACFSQYPLKFVLDYSYGAVPDKNYPGRAYLSPDAPLLNSIRSYSFGMRFPSSIPSGDLLIQWMYITANSCNPPGYNYYPFPWPGVYNSQLGDCQVTGSTTWNGERFWNCAEVTMIINDSPTSSQPSSKPSVKPSLRRPTSRPSNRVSRKPTRKPSNKKPSKRPSFSRPTRRPSKSRPSRKPTPRRPTKKPTKKPTNRKPTLPSTNPIVSSTPSPVTNCCSSGVTGNFASNYCQGYIACVNGVNYGYVACPMGTLFNNIAGYCDWPSNVVCNTSCGTPISPSTSKPTKKPDVSSPTNAPMLAPVSPPPPTSGGKIRVAPYYEVSQVNPSLSGLKHVTFAFAITDSFNNVSFENDPPLGKYQPLISSFQSGGGKAIASFGGATCCEYAMSQSNETLLFAGYEQFYTSLGIKIWDFDIEGTNLVDATTNARRNRVLAKLQAKYSDLEIMFTLPVAPFGMTSDGIAFVQNAKNAGIKISLVNGMVMDYGTVTSNSVNLANSKSALNGLRSQLNAIDNNINMGATPMIGKDDTGNVFTVSDMKIYLDWIVATHPTVTHFAFWAMHRDKPGNGPLYANAGITDFTAGDYLNLFKQYQ